MATQTENYGLIKPARTDNINIEDLNNNFDIIDTELKKMQSSNSSTEGTGGATDEQVADAVAAYMAENPVENGYTPVKGVDYYTEEEQTEMVQAVMGEFPSIVSVAVTETDTTVTMSYALDDGGTMSDTITFDASGYATNINANGIDIPVTWGVS